jgi:hypothetical protein
MEARVEFPSWVVSKPGSFTTLYYSSLFTFHSSKGGIEHVALGTSVRHELKPNETRCKVISSSPIFTRFQESFRFVVSVSFSFLISLFFGGKVLFAGVGLTDKFVVDGTYVYSSLPCTPGYEMIGEVMEVGKQCTKIKQGTRVAALTTTGSWAAEIVLNEDDLVPIPEKLLDSLNYPAAIPLILNYVTAYQMLTRVSEENKRGKPSCV